MPIGAIKSLVPKTTSDFLSSFLRGKGEGPLLLVGPSLSVRCIVAKELVSSYLCTGIQAQGCPCASCRAGSENPDLLEVKMSAAGNILKASTDALLSFLEDMSVLSEKRAAVVHNAEKMTPTAMASLLKILENPLRDFLVVFTVGSRSDLPPTLRSRAPQIYVGGSNRETSFMRLTNSGCSPKVAEELSKVCTFLKLDPVEDKDLILTAHKAVPFVIQNIFKGKALAAIKKVQAFLTENKDPKALHALLGLLIVTVTDVQKIQFRASSHICMPSRLEWLNGLKEDVPNEDALLRVVNTLTSVRRASPQILRSALLWSVMASSEHFSKTSLQRKEDI